MDPKGMLDKLLREEGISGYSIQGKKITIFVEDEKAAMKASALELFKEYEVEVVVTGRFEAL